MGSRREFVKALGASAAVVCGSAPIVAQTAAQTAPPPGGAPPRDFGANAPPSPYPGPDVVAGGPSFCGPTLGNTPLKPLWIGAVWAEGPAGGTVGRVLRWGGAGRHPAVARG